MQDQWIEWLQEKRRHFFYGVILIIAAFFIAFQFYGKFHRREPKRYFLTASQAFDKWMYQGEAFEKLEKALQSQPELETKFGALIADRFIAQNEGDKAQPFADNVFTRVLKHTPEHTAFAEGSLLIAKGNLREALTQSISLKERLGNHTLLYGFNLIRIASLYRALGARDQELASLEELERYLKEDKKTSTLLSECFREGDVTLQDYIAERKK